MGSLSQFRPTGYCHDKQNAFLRVPGTFPQVDHNTIPKHNS